MNPFRLNFTSKPVLIRGVYHVTKGPLSKGTFCIEVPCYAFIHWETGWHILCSRMIHNSLRMHRAISRSSSPRSSAGSCNISLLRISENSCLLSQYDYKSEHEAQVLIVYDCIPLISSLWCTIIWWLFHYSLVVCFDWWSYSRTRGSAAQAKTQTSATGWKAADNQSTERSANPFKSKQTNQMRWWC